MHPHRVLVEPTADGWRIRRPGWPCEVLDDRTWAERVAASLAFEFHQHSGRPACAVLAAATGETVLARFGEASGGPSGSG